MMKLLQLYRQRAHWENREEKSARRLRDSKQICFKNWKSHEFPRQRMKMKALRQMGIHPPCLFFHKFGDKLGNWLEWRTRNIDRHITLAEARKLLRERKSRRRPKEKKANAATD